jgi:hypothetical protein
MNWPAFITAVTALVSAIGGIVALVLHSTGPSHQAPTQHAAPPPAPPTATRPAPAADNYGRDYQ